MFRSWWISESFIWSNHSEIRKHSVKFAEIGGIPRYTFLPKSIITLGRLEIHDFPSGYQ